jgi:YHS domain-containing protein
MRTGMFWAGVLGLLPLLLLSAGCRSGCCQCRSGCGDTHAAPASVPSGGNPVAVVNQKTCPVSGQPLAGVANPVSVTVKGQTVQVCCQQCAAKLMANPDAYLGASAGQTATSSNAVLYGGQKTCPVTGEELDPAGGATPVTVRGQTIYVCCAGCAAKVKLFPEKYLAKVAAERAATH